MKKIKSVRLLWKRIILISLALLFITACVEKLTMKNIHTKPNFSAEVLEVKDNSISVMVLENSNSSNVEVGDILYMSNEAQLSDSFTDFEEGQYINVYYDGTIQDDTLTHIYAFTLK